MNLHEYQAKQLFTKFGIAVPDGMVADSSQAALAAAQSLGGDAWMVKAQVHAGGRGKAGGVKRAQGLSELQQIVDALLQTRLVTAQSGSTGQPVNKVLIELAQDAKIHPPGRRAAMEALGRVGYADQEIIDVLTRIATTKERKTKDFERLAASLAMNGVGELELALQ